MQQKYGIDALIGGVLVGNAIALFCSLLLGQLSFMLVLIDFLFLFCYAGILFIINAYNRLISLQEPPDITEHYLEGERELAYADDDYDDGYVDDEDNLPRPRQDTQPLTRGSATEAVTSRKVAGIKRITRPYTKGKRYA